MHFDLKHTEQHSKARAAELHTDHGVIETPIFMPVGTVGTVKAINQKQLNDEIKAQIDIQREELILRIQKISDELLKRLDDYKEECKENIKNLDEQIIINNDYVKYLKNYYITISAKEINENSKNFALR